MPFSTPTPTPRASLPFGNDDCDRQMRRLSPQSDSTYSPLVGPLEGEPDVPSTIASDYRQGYTQNRLPRRLVSASCTESSTKTAYTEAARFKRPEPNTVGLLQPKHLDRPRYLLDCRGEPKGSGHYGYTPIGEWSAQTWSRTDVQPMVDGHVRWTQAEFMRLPKGNVRMLSLRCITST